MFKRLLHSKATAVTALALLVVGAGAGSAVAGRYGSQQGCTVTSATSQPFTRWHDDHSYFLAPGGDMENPLTSFGWQLSGNATLGAGNEPWHVTGNSNDSQSLYLPDGGSSAQTPAICVTAHDPELRLFLRNSGNHDAKLDVTCVFTANDGKTHSKEVADLNARDDWSLSEPVKFHDCIQPGPDGTGQVSFVFTPEDNKGNWQLDDLYIDPIKSQ